jgi:hypothetical protein
VTTAVREAPHHNKLTCIKHYGCRRPECVERYRTYQRERYHGRTTGTWQPLVDAEPVRQHILKLQATNFTAVRISELADLPFETVVGFLRAYGNAGYRKSRKRRCTPEVAAKILAVTPDAGKPGVVDATGTIRRLRALVAAGFPMQHLGPRISLSCRTVRALIRQERVYGRTAEAVDRLFEELKNENPAKHGIDRRSISRARSYAKDRKWATVKYWADRMDVIDDPHFEPMYGVTRGATLAADARELFGYGVPVEQAAERLGVTRNHLQQELLRHPAPAEEVAA